MLRVIHSSFACDPTMGSEPYVGWKWAEMVSDFDYELHVVTRKHHRLNILKSGLLKNIKFHYFDLPFLSRLDHRSKLMKSYYLVWQTLVFPYVLLLHIKYRFNIVHHITYNNIDVPGFLWLLPGSKFLWGPVGGGQIPPASLKKVYGVYWKKEVARKLLKSFARFNPVVRLAISKSSCVMFANKDTYMLVEGVPQKYIFMLETAIEVKAEEKIEFRKKIDGHLNLLWVGRIEHRKALILAIDSLIELRKRGRLNNIKLDVVGDGPLMDDMKLYCKTNLMQDTIFFHGVVPFNEVAKFYKESDVFLFTSVQDTSGNVLLEAMKFGKPSIALKHQGAYEILEYGGGILVPVSGYMDTIYSFTDAIERFQDSRVFRLKLGEEARNVLNSKFTWEQKSKKVKELYFEVLS